MAKTKKKKPKIECVESKLQAKYTEGDPRYSDAQAEDRLRFARDQYINFIVYKSETIADTEHSNKGCLMGQEMLARTLANLKELRRREIKDGFSSGMKIEISFEDDEEEINNAPNYVEEAISEGIEEHNKEKEIE